MTETPESRLLQIRRLKLDEAVAHAAVGQATLELKKIQNNIVQLQSCCHHSWETKYTPEIREGYMTQGDPPGTMGIDRQLPMYIPRQETPKWTRRCSLCEKTEETKRTTKEQVEKPVF